MISQRSSSYKNLLTAICFSGCKVRIFDGRGCNHLPSCMMDVIVPNGWNKIWYPSHRLEIMTLGSESKMIFRHNDSGYECDGYEFDLDLYNSKDVCTERIGKQIIDCITHLLYFNSKMPIFDLFFGKKYDIDGPTKKDIKKYESNVKKQLLNYYFCQKNTTIYVLNNYFILDIRKNIINMFLKIDNWDVLGFYVQL